MTPAPPTLCALLTLLIGGCHPAPFDTTFAAPEASEAAPAPKPPSVEGLKLEPWSRLETHVDAPTPSFSPDGRWLVYQALQEQPEIGGSRRVLRVLDVPLNQDRVVYVHDDYPDYQDAYQPIDTFRPTFLDEHALLSGTLDLEHAPMTTRISLGGVARPFSERGAAPRVRPDGQRVLLQSARGILEVDVFGEVVAEHPGYNPVWHPEGEGFVAQMTPFALSIDFRHVEPVEGLESPETNVGGLLRVTEGAAPERLTPAGGNPSFHPDGESFVFETLPDGVWMVSLLGIDSLPLLKRYDLQRGAAQDLGLRGTHVSHHPSGAFFAFTGQGGLMVSDGDVTRPLEIPGERALFSPDGQHLLTLETRESRARGVVRDVVLYRITE